MNKTELFKTISRTEANRILEKIDGVRHFAESDVHLSFYLLEGNLEIDGNLEFDCHDVVIIQGDLAVNGIIQDEYLTGNELNMFCVNDYSLVYVFGSVKARHVISGSYLHILGNLEVDGIIYLNSLGIDMLKVDGFFRSKYLIDEGHMIDCDNIEAERILVSDRFESSYSDSEKKSIITEEYFADRMIFHDKRIDPEVLYLKLVEDKPVFSDAFFKML